jgi:phosphatidylinositol alpha-1,6-mannosyltransferase
LLITPDFPPARGGIQVLMHRLVQHVPDASFRVVTIGHADAPAFDADAPFDIIRISASPLPWACSIATLNLRALAEGRAFRPDVVISGHIVTSPAAVAIRRPWVQYIYAKEMGARPSLTRFALSRADATVAISRYTRSLALSAGVRPERVELVPPGVDAGSLGPRRAWHGEPVVLTIGRLEDAYKGVDVLIRGLPLVRACVPDAQLVIIGDGSLRRSLEALAETHGVRDAVEFVGTVTDDERDAWFDRAAAFAMPSRLPPGGKGGDGFGIVYLEASARGVPVVAGNTGGAVDAVSDGVTGLLVDPTDHVQVADALISILSTPALRMRLAANGPAWAAKFAWPKPAERVGDILRAVV